MTANRPADDVRELRQQVEQTRERLGETVEQLVAKTDVKARAKDRAAALAVRVKGQASQAWAQAVERARKMRGQLAGQAGTREQTMLLDTPDRRQSPARIPAAGATAWQALPEPTRQAAAKAADSTRERRVQFVAAAAVLIAGSGVVLWVWRR